MPTSTASCGPRRAALVQLGLALCLLGASACVADLETRRGSEGEPCFADDDCRQGLLCQSNTCSASADANNGDANNGDANNGDANNGDANNGANNGDTPTVAELCLEACVYFEACGLPLDGSPELCARQCQSELQGPQDVVVDQLQCLLELECRELSEGVNDCFSGEIDGEREALCDQVSFEVIPSCLGRESFLFEDICFDQATFQNDREFFVLSRCLEFNSCDAILSCVEDWSGTSLREEDPPPPDPSEGFDILGIVDLSQERRDDGFRGADIDSVALFKANGQVYYASTLYDAQIQSTRADDLAQALGPPDSECDITSGRHVSMGGQESYMVLGFDALIEPGDTLLIYELGPTWCGNQDQQDDEMYLVLLNQFSQETVELGLVRGANSLFVDF